MCIRDRRWVGLTWSSTSPRQGARTGFPPARQSATPIVPTCRTPSDTKAPLALGKSAREKTSLGSWEAPLRSAPRIGLTYSGCLKTVSYTHLRAHETRHDLVCRLLLEKKKK